MFMFCRDFVVSVVLGFVYRMSDSSNNYKNPCWHYIDLLHPVSPEIMVDRINDCGGCALDCGWTVHN